jgi:hypothetical protein
LSYVTGYSYCCRWLCPQPAVSTPGSKSSSTCSRTSSCSKSNLYNGVSNGRLRDACAQRCHITMCWAQPRHYKSGIQVPQQTICSVRLLQLLKVTACSSRGVSTCVMMLAADSLANLHKNDAIRTPTHDTSAHTLLPKHRSITAPQQPAFLARR